MLKILLVDDEQTAKKSLRNIIQMDSENYFVVGEVEDGIEALEKIDELCPDIVITDIRMPRMDGLQLAKEIKQHKHYIEMIIVSGYDEFTYAQQAVKYGVTDYLLKPIVPDEVLAALSNIKEKVARTYKETLINRRMMNHLETILDEICRLVWTLNKDALLKKLNVLKEEIRRTSRYEARAKEMYSFVFSYIYEEMSTISEKRIALHENDLQLFIRRSNMEALYDYLFSMMEQIGQQRNWNSMTSIATALDWIKDNYRKSDFSLGKAADVAKMSPTYFSKCFKEETGQNFTDYITELRMKKAAELLQMPEVKVYWVAHTVGYNEYSHFTRTFKRFFKISPSEYRRQMNVPLEQRG